MRILGFDGRIQLEKWRPGISMKKGEVYLLVNDFDALETMVIGELLNDTDDYSITLTETILIEDNGTVRPDDYPYSNIWYCHSDLAYAKLSRTLYNRLLKRYYGNLLPLIKKRTRN